MWPFQPQSPRRDRTTSRRGRRARPAIEAAESRLSLSGFAVAQVGAICGFNPQPDPPAMRAGIIAI